METIRELFDGWASAELTFEVALSFSGKLDFVSDGAREAIELSEVVKDCQTNHFGGVRFKLDVSCGIKMIDAFDQTNYTCADNVFAVESRELSGNDSVGCAADDVGIV